MTSRHVSRPQRLAAALGLALLAGALAGCDAAADPSAAGTGTEGTVAAGAGAWRHAALWDDGKAEYCAYEVTWARYGHLWPGTALLVLVKEPWAPDLEVKADHPRRDGFDVLKLNHVRDVPTGIYTYHQMASAFLRRDDGSLEKLTAASTEACGISTATVAGGRLDTHSYFDGQGRRSQPWPAGALPEDGLPALLRDYLSGPAPASLSLFPSLLAGRYAELAAAPWRVDRRPAAPVRVPAGEFSGVELRLSRGDAWLTYTFEDREPHSLLRHTRHDGTEYRLAKCERIAYWEMHDPGGDAWYPQGFGRQ